MGSRSNMKSRNNYVVQDANSSYQNGRGSNMMNKTTNVGNLKKSTTSQLQQQNSYINNQSKGVGSSVGSTKNNNQPPPNIN